MPQVEAGKGALIRALNLRAEVFDLDDLRFDFTVYIRLFYWIIEVKKNNIPEPEIELLTLYQTFTDTIFYLFLNIFI